MLHVLVVGIIRQLCDLNNKIQIITYSLLLSPVRAIANTRFWTLSPDTSLFSYTPLYCYQQFNQEGITGKICRESTPFWWICLMGLSCAAHDDEQLLQSALCLDFINKMLCNTHEWTLYNILMWQL